MTSRLPKCLPLLMLGLAIAVPAGARVDDPPGPPGSEARRVLDRAAEAHKALTGLEARGQLTATWRSSAEARVAPVEVVREWPLAIAFERPGRFVYRGPSIELAGDAERLLAFTPEWFPFRLHAEGKPPARFDLDGLTHGSAGALLIEPEPIGPLNRAALALLIDEDPAAALLNGTRGEPTLEPDRTVDGRVCRVLRLEPKARRSLRNLFARATPTGLIRLLIDAETNRLRVVEYEPVEQPDAAEPTIRRLTWRIETFLDGPPPEHVLALTIPAGSNALASPSDLALIPLQPDPLEVLPALADAMVARDPEDGRAYFERADSRVFFNDLEAAVADFDRGLELSPEAADAEVYAGRAYALERLDRDEEALADLDEALRRDPDHFAARYNRALVLANLGHPLRALADLDRAKELDATDPDVFQLRGYVLRQLDDPAAALADYDRAVRLAPDDPTLRRDRAETLLTLGRAEEALAEANRLVESSPEDPDSLLFRADLRRQAGRIDDALADLTEALKLDPDLADAHRQRGYIEAMDRDDQQAALAEYERALRIDPGLEIARINRAWSLARIDRHREAIAELDRALTLDPDQPDALTNRGYSRAALGEYGRAVDDYSASLRLRPNDVDTLAFRAEAHANRGAIRQALADYERLLRLEPEVPEWRAGRAWTRLRLSDFPGALTDFDALIASGRREADDFARRGIIRAQLGDPAGALEDYNEAIQLDPNDADIRVLRAEVLESMGRDPEAVEELRESLRIGPDSAEVRLARGMICLKLGRLDEALADLDRAVALDPDNAGTRNARATAHGQQGRFDLALEDFDAVVRLKPDLPDGYVGRSLTLRALGEPEAARADLVRAYQLSGEDGRSRIIELIDALGDP